MAKDAAGRGGAAAGVLAAGLVGLRDNAEGPVGIALETATGLSARVIADALGGEKLPTLDVTLKLVAAWGGDVEAWEAYWNQIAELVTPPTDAAAETTGETTGDTPKTDAAEPAPEPAPEILAADVPAPPPLAEPVAAEAPPTTATAKAKARDEVAKEPARATTSATATAANAASIPPKTPRSQPAEPTPPRREPRRRLHRIFVALVILAAAASGLTTYFLIHSDDSTNTAQQPTAHPTTTLPSPSATAPKASVTPTPTPTPTSSATPSPSQTPTAADTPTYPSATLSSSNSRGPGTLLGLYPKIQLPSGYSVDFLNDTYHPVPGTDLGGDALGLSATGPAAGRFIASQAVLFDSGEPGTFERCLNDTRYQQDVSLTALSVGSQFCVHGKTGELVLVKVDRLPQPQDANPYVMIDVTVWQGH